MNNFKKMSLPFLAGIILLFSLSNCKKEIGIPDDPSITYISASKTFNTFLGSTNVDSFDINGDGKSEFIFYNQSITIDTAIIVIFTNQNFSFALGSQNPPFVQVYTLNEVLPTSPSIYTAAFYAYYLSALFGNTSNGVFNSEQYLAFRFTTGTKYQYGWMKVSVNKTVTEFKIIEYAYSSEYEKPIKVGAR